MFAVVDEVPLTEVLDAWSEDIIRAFEAVHLFDLPRGPIIYRVFLLPGWLELDLSFTPASEFGAGGPSSGSCSGRLSISRRNHRLPQTSCSDTPSTTHCTRESLSSVVVIGRLSIGSARCATTGYTRLSQPGSRWMVRPGLRRTARRGQRSVQRCTRGIARPRRAPSGARERSGRAPG